LKNIWLKTLSQYFNLKIGAIKKQNRSDKAQRVGGYEKWKMMQNDQRWNFTKRNQEFKQSIVEKKVKENKAVKRKEYD
jgi:hypothetical protein